MSVVAVSLKKKILKSIQLNGILDGWWRSRQLAVDLNQGVMSTCIRSRIAVVRRRHQDSLALEMGVSALTYFFDLEMVAVGRSKRLVILIEDDWRCLVV